jgi:curved DNA-binding protein CbpA
MIDSFAVLDQPRAPWLDPASLKDAYHRKTLQAHPDTATAGDAENSFAQLNQAYQVLQDPKRRLQHLLELQGHAPTSSDQTVPQELQDLFPAIGALAQRANLVLEKTRTASNALSRSLLKPQILAVQKEIKELRDKVHGLSEALLVQLRETSSRWTKNPAGEVAALSNLYFAFAYLTRWSAQLDEIAFRLSLH